MQLSLKTISKYKSFILYGISMALVIFLLKWLELRFIIISHSLEVYIGAIAVIFTCLGIWLALRLTKPKIETVIVEKEVFVTPPTSFIQNEKEVEKLGLSKRELEVLEQMSLGLSNTEIADKLFVSLNTVKTHSSNIFIKLDVKRRTQAVEKAKRLNIIP